MPSASTTFVELIGAILDRYFRQNDLPALNGLERDAIGARLWLMVSLRGVPPAVAEAAQASTPEMKAEEVAPLIATIVENSTRAGDLMVPLRQLVKTCFQAERSRCRESYKETSTDGVCRRQQRERVRSRVSGTHCVDCPYWNSLDASAHALFLANAWCGERDVLVANVELFLPEDFRALRRWLREQPKR